MKPRALVVDDDEGLRYTLTGILEDHDLDVEAVGDVDAALERLDDEEAPPIHLVITDQRMPGRSGLDLLAVLSARSPAPKAILITAHGNEAVAVEAMKRGAYDYIKKPFDNDQLLAVVERAVESVRLQAENERLQAALALSRTMVFESEPMRRVALLVQRVAPRDVTVLIRGESGTGKERIAEAIVRSSRRADRPFVRFNCAALSPDLAEAELFGHRRGAFTGAERDRTGLVRAADGGTLLLDEVGELALPTQAKLLRLLQERQVRPVGSDATVPVDVRFIAATHRDMAERVAEGSFREDLYYRLKVVELVIPPLRDRREDIGVLARFFLDRAMARHETGPLAEPPELMEWLRRQPWPGNVRELENVIESLVALSADGELDLSLVDTSSPAKLPTPPRAGGGSLRDRLDAYERQLIVEALDQADGNRSEAARQLEIGRATLHDKLRKHGLD